MPKILILADYNPQNKLHLKMTESLELIQEFTDLDFEFDWVSTDEFKVEMLQNEYSGIWIGPGSPYRSMENVLKAINFARLKQIPTLGTCAGFQHMLIEFAQNACNLSDADHEETNSQSQNLVISKLSCSLVGQKEQLTVTDKNSKIYQLLQISELEGEYHCNYGFNQTYLDTLKNHGCHFTVFSTDQQVRAFELNDHPFFIGTLFQVQLLKLNTKVNPIILGFVQSSIKNTNQ